MRTQPSIKEREEDYHRARERIIGGAETVGGGGPLELQSASSVGSGSGVGMIPYASGGYMARGGGRDGSGFGGGRGRGRKAVFRDKDREMQDPDYTRRDGTSTYGSDGMGYGMEVRANGQTIEGAIFYLMAMHTSSLRLLAFVCP